MNEEANKGEKIKATKKHPIAAELGMNKLWGQDQIILIFLQEAMSLNLIDSFYFKNKKGINGSK